MKFFILLALCTFLVAAETNKKEVKPKAADKPADDLKTQETRSAYNTYDGPPGHRKNEYGLIDEYPPSGYGKLGDHGSSGLKPYRKGLEPSSGYQSGYGGFDNRGPLLPGAYGNRDHGSSPYSGPSYSSGPASVPDSYPNPPSGYREPNTYSRPSNDLSKPLGGGYSSYSGPSSSSYGSHSKPLSGYEQSKYGGYSKPSSSSGLRYSKPSSSSGGYGKPSNDYDSVRTYGAYSSAPPSGYGSSGSSSHSPRPYSAPSSPSAPKPYGGYRSTGGRGYSPPSSHSSYARPPPASGSGYSAPSPGGYAAPAPHRGYAPPSHSGYAPSTSYSGPSSSSGYAPSKSYSGPSSSSGYAPKIPYSGSVGHAPKPHSTYYAPESLGGYAAPPSPISYAPKAHGSYSSSAHSNNYGSAPASGYSSGGYGPDGYGKTYGTVTQKEYSKTVESYGSSSGELGGHNGGVYRNGLARRGIQSDHGLLGGPSYGRSYDSGREDREKQPQAYSEDQAIYGGYGHLY